MSRLRESRPAQGQRYYLNRALPPSPPVGRVRADPGRRGHGDEHAVLLWFHALGAAPIEKGVSQQWLGTT